MPPPTRPGQPEQDPVEEQRRQRRDHAGEGRHVLHRRARRVVVRVRRSVGLRGCPRRVGRGGCGGAAVRVRAVAGRRGDRRAPGCRQRRRRRVRRQHRRRRSRVRHPLVRRPTEPTPDRRCAHGGGRTRWRRSTSGRRPRSPGRGTTRRSVLRSDPTCWPSLHAGASTALSARGTAASRSGRARAPRPARARPPRAPCRTRPDRRATNPRAACSPPPLRARAA